VDATDTAATDTAATDTAATDTEATDTVQSATVDSATDLREAEPTTTRARHGHRRAPKRRRAPVGLLLGVVRLPGRLLRLRPSRLPWYGGIVLAALIVAALVLDGMSWQADRNHRAMNTDRGDALVAATSGAQKALSFDYRTINADIARAKAMATGPFLSDYTKTAASLLKEVGPLKAIAQATVQSGSVVNAANGRVTVLLFVDQAAVMQQPGSKTPDTKIVQYRVQMTMQKLHGRWLVYSLTSE
jgi:Mce-associated membrane protein